MIYLKTDDDTLAGELLSGFHDRAVVNVGSSAFVICDIARNLSSAGDVSVEAKGERVVTLPWNGTGLPPVGVVCEWEHEANKGNWHKAEIKYLGSTYVIVADFAGIEQHYYLRSMQFRPIRTPEQIAAEERIAALKAMRSDCPYPGSGSTAIDCEALYDKGYRKQSTKQDDQQ